MARFRVLAGWTVLLIVAVLAVGRLQRPEPETVWSANGVHMEQVALAGLVPAVAASDVETGTCDVQRAVPNGTRAVHMTFPGGRDEIRHAAVLLDASGALMNYSEFRQTGKEITSVMIDVSAGTGGMTNVTEGGSRVTIGRGTADEALRSEALGSPARRIETILARCGRPGEASTQS